MKKLEIEILRSDIDKLIMGLTMLKDDFDLAEDNKGYLNLQFLQADEYLIILKIDKKGKILK